MSLNPRSPLATTTKSSSLTILLYEESAKTRGGSGPAGFKPKSGSVEQGLGCWLVLGTPKASLGPPVHTPSRVPAAALLVRGGGKGSQHPAWVPTKADSCFAPSPQGPARP